MYLLVKSLPYYYYDKMLDGSVELTSLDMIDYLPHAWGKAVYLSFWSTVDQEIFKYSEEKFSRYSDPHGYLATLATKFYDQTRNITTRMQLYTLLSNIILGAHARSVHSMQVLTAASQAWPSRL